MKKLLFLFLIFLVLPCQAAETPYTAILALDATNSGTTTTYSGTSTFVIYSDQASRQMRIETGARGVYDASKMRGWLRSDGYHTLTILEMTSSVSQASAGGDYDSLNCDIYVEYTPVDTDAAWAKAKTVTIFDDIALSGASRQPVRFYPVWGSDFFRFKMLNNSSVTEYNKCKIRYDMK